MADTMQYFSIYEEEFERELIAINHKLAQRPEYQDAKQQKSFVMEMECALNEAQVTLQQMQREVYGLSPLVRGTFMEKLAQHQSEYKQARDQLNLYCVAKITSSGSLAPSASRETLLEFSKLQEPEIESSRMLHASYQTSLQTEQIGGKVIMELKRQREQLENSQRNLRNVDSSLDRSGKLLSRLKRALLFNKYLTILFALCCLGILGGFLYIKNKS